MKYDIIKIKDFLIDQLTDLKGQNIDICLCDLSNTITQTINCNGVVSGCTYYAVEFLQDNWYFIGDVVDYYKNTLDITINPFSAPDKGEVLAYMCGVENLINQSEVLSKADEKAKYKEFTLTDTIIDNFIEELNSLEIELKNKQINKVGGLLTARGV